MKNPNDEPVLDLDHLDSRGWNMLVHNAKAERAAVVLQEGMEAAGREILKDIEGGADWNRAAQQSFREFVEPSMQRYSEFGANDTEPRDIAQRLLGEYAQALFIRIKPSPKPIRISLVPFENPIADFHRKIASGVVEETNEPYEVHVDEGGPNREHPGITDPALLIIMVDGRRWKIPVAEIAAEMSRWY